MSVYFEIVKFIITRVNYFHVGYLQISKTCNLTNVIVQKLGICEMHVDLIWSNHTRLIFFFILFVNEMKNMFLFCLKVTDNSF